MNQQMFEAVNMQIGHEIYNSFVYLSMSNFYYQQKMDGLGKHYKNQSKEEMGHAQKFIDYLLKFDFEQQIKLPIVTPTQEWNNVFMPLDSALALEQKTTSQINELMKMSVDTNDYATQELLQWFIAEQVQEENQARDIIMQAKLDGSYNPLALRLLNDSLQD